MRYNNNTSSGHVRDNVQPMLMYADERKEYAWNARLRQAEREKARQPRNVKNPPRRAG